MDLVDLLRDIVICFFLFAFCGWVCECIFCTILEKKVTNRGFLTGPLCPVYGFGGLIVVYLLAPLRENLLLLFLMGMVSTTALEYLTSYVLEKLFATKWWDYSHIRFHINGRVCPPFSLAFGALSVVAVRLLYPPFSVLLLWIPAVIKPWLARGLLLAFGADCCFSIYNVLAINGRLEELKALSQELRQKLEALEGNHLSLQERLDKMRADTTERTAALRKSLEALDLRWEAKREALAKRLGTRRLMNAFPNMRSMKYEEQMAELRASLAALKQKREKKSKKVQKRD